MRILSVSVLMLALRSWTCTGEETKDAAKPEAGQVTAQGDGLHGYIGFSASRPPARSEFSAGMGFYSAVWPLIDRDYMAPPSRGTLVSLDPALFVTPPPGLEVGYVPIVTGQSKL